MEDDLKILKVKYLSKLDHIFNLSLIYGVSNEDHLQWRTTSNCKHWNIY